MLPNFVGDQLRLARMCMGWSLDELGAKCSVSRQYLHQVENGSKLPTEDMERVLAEVLGVKSKFFRLNGVPQVRPEQVHFRKQLTTPISIATQVIARGTMTDRIVDALDRVLKLPSVNFPDIAATTNSEIEMAAEKARRFWGLGTDSPISSMMRVAENAGAVVTHFEGLSERVDALSMDRPRPIIVRGDAKASLCRQRFDIAHEIGHLVMHRGIVTGDSVTEKQAHRFAGAFLIPASTFVREFPRSGRLNWPAIFQMKLRWKVAARAIIHRAFDLGVISAAQYRSANIYLVKSGQAKAEKYDDQLALESPELLVAAMSALASRQGRLEKLMDDLGLENGMLTALTSRTWIVPQEFRDNVVSFPSGAVRQSN